MWKLYKVGSSDAWLRAEGQIMYVVDYNFDDHVSTFIVETINGREVWPTPTRNVEIIEQDTKPGELDKTSVEICSLICKLNAERADNDNIMPNTSRDQRFSYNTHDQIGGRKLNGDR